MANSSFVDDVTLLEGGDLDTDYLGAYEDAQTKKPLPPEGKYTLRMPDKFSYELSDDKKVLKVLIDPAIIVGGENDGYEIRFIRVSTKKFPKDNGSSAGDIMRNFGVDVASLKTVKDWAEAFERIAGQITPTPVNFIWEAYDKETKVSVKYQKNFPKKEDGDVQSFLLKTDGEGKEYRVWANLKTTARGFNPVQR